MWKRRRRYRDKSMKYAPQPFDNEKQYYGGFASGRPYIKSTWQVDDFMMPYSYKPPKPPTWSPHRKYPNPYKPKPQLKKYDDTAMEPIREPISKPVPRDNLVPPLVLYEPAYERHLAAFNKSARLTNKYSKMLDDKRYSKKMHNALYKALEREHNRREVIVAAPPLPKRKQLPPLEGRTIEEAYAPIEDKEHARLITYRDGDTMTVAQAIEDERRENAQPRQITWIDDDPNEIVEARTVEHQNYRRNRGNNLLNQRRQENYDQRQIEERRQQHTLAIADDVEADKKYVFNNRVEEHQFYKNAMRDAILTSNRVIGIGEDTDGIRRSAVQLRKEGQLPIPKHTAQYLDKVYSQRRPIDDSRTITGTMAIEAPSSSKPMIVIRDGDVADSSKSIQNPKYIED